MHEMEQSGNGLLFYAYVEIFLKKSHKSNKITIKIETKRKNKKINKSKQLYKKAKKANKRMLL